MEDGVAMPEDVLFEILVNLPVKSLLRFSCVSKYWCFLINSPNFVSRHLKRDCKEIMLLRRRYPAGEREFLSFHDPDSPDSLISPNLPIPQFLVGKKRYDFMGTCNGLVCLASLKTIILCNPALREFELLPPRSFRIPTGYVHDDVVMGFGFDAISDAYKITQLVSAVNPNSFIADIQLRIDLYNPTTNSWRPIEAVVPRCIIYGSEFNLFVNGACHWNACISDSDGILSFDLSTEIFRYFELPHFEDGKVEDLMELNQCLALLRYGDEESYSEQQVVEIWVMTEYGVKES